MTNEEKDFLCELIYAMGENFSANLSETGVKLYVATLSQYKISEIREAADKIIRHRKYKNMPTIGEFLEYIHGNTDENAELEASKIMTAIQRIGPYRSVFFENATTQAVIEQYGGWPALINESEKYPNMALFKKEIAKTYKALAREGKCSYNLLPGICDQHSVKGGKQFISIGKETKALPISNS